MSDEGVRTSISGGTLKISEVTKFSSENFRVRDLANIVPVGSLVRRTNENNESHSPLGFWMKEESPFSHRQLMVHGGSGARKKSFERSLVHELGELRGKFTPDGYGSVMDVVATVDYVRKEIKWNEPLSELTVRQKNAFQESLGLYEEHFSRISSGFLHAKFSEEVGGVIGQVKSEVNQVLEMIREVSGVIKVEIRPSLADISILRV